MSTREARTTRWRPELDGLARRANLPLHAARRPGLSRRAQGHGRRREYSLDRLADAKVNAPNASLLLSPIEGYEDAKGGKATELRGVKALSPNEVEIRVDRPAEGDLLVRLAHVSTGIVARESVEKGGANWSTTQANGTGPFRLAEWSLRQRIALAAHPGYFGGAPKIGKVVFEIVPEPAVGVQKYEAGELDIVQVPASDYGRLKADAKLGQELAEINRSATVFLMLNQKAYAPFKDIRVRQAVAHAINRPQMARTALQGLYEAASGVLPPGFPGNTGALLVIPFDPARAKTLLTEAGFPGGKGLPPLVLGPNPRGFGPRLAAEVVAAMLQENLGMQVQVQVLDIAKWRQDLRKADVFAGVTGWTADIADPNYYLFALFDTKAPFAYFSGYASPAYEEKLATANREPNRAELLKKLRDVEQFLVVTDVGVVPLYHIREASSQTVRRNLTSRRTASGSWSTSDGGDRPLRRAGRPGRWASLPAGRASTSACPTVGAAGLPRRRGPSRRRGGRGSVQPLRRHQRRRQPPRKPRIEVIALLGALAARTRRVAPRGLPLHVHHPRSHPVRDPVGEPRHHQRRAHGPRGLHRGWGPARARAVWGRPERTRAPAHRDHGGGAAALARRCGHVPRPLPPARRGPGAAEAGAGAAADLPVERA